MWLNCCSSMVFQSLGAEPNAHQHRVSEQERAAFSLGPRPGGTPATLLLRSHPAHRRVSQSPGVGPSVQGGGVAWTGQQVSASGAKEVSALTDRQSDSALDLGGASGQWLLQQKPRKLAAQRKGNVDSPGPEGSPRSRGPAALETPEGTECHGSRSCRTLGEPRAGEAPVPHGGARGTRLCENTCRGPSAGTVCNPSPGSHRGDTRWQLRPRPFCCGDSCARHADDILKTAASSRATPRPEHPSAHRGLCSPWSGHPPPTVCPSVGTAERLPCRAGLMTPGVTCLAASFVPPHVGTRYAHGRAPCLTNEALHSHDV